MTRPTAAQLGAVGHDCADLLERHGRSYGELHFAIVIGLVYELAGYRDGRVQGSPGIGGWRWNRETRREG